MMHSYDNNREKMCDRLHAGGVRALCAHSLFGPLLAFYVCNARIVVLEHYYNNASLETHRVDTLLLLGKVVVSTPSGDAELDRAYQDFVLFSQPEDIADSVQRVLTEWALFDKYQRARQAHFTRWVRNIDPLCYALRSLRSM
jgi:hypothetical protein